MREKVQYIFVWYVFSSFHESPCNFSKNSRYYESRIV